MVWRYELPMSRTDFNGPNDVRAIEVRQHTRLSSRLCSMRLFIMERNLTAVICYTSVYEKNNNLAKINWAGAQHFLRDCVCAQQRLRSACASAQADQRLRCQPEYALGDWLLTERPAKYLNRLHGSAGWSESSLVAHAIISRLNFPEANATECKRLIFNGNVDDFFLHPNTTIYVTMKIWSDWMSLACHRWILCGRLQP